MAWQGFFKPINPSKYLGASTNIVYRSSLEFKFMRYLDATDSIVEWASEEMYVPYVSPVDNRWHRYFPDFVIKQKSKDGSIETIMIEIKPSVQCSPPKEKKLTKRHLREVIEWGRNSAKWEAAQAWCRDHNWRFVVITEKDIAKLGPKFGKRNK